MLQLSDKGIRLLITVLTISLIIGALAIVGVVVYLVVMAAQGDYVLPMLLAEGLQLTEVVKANDIVSFSVYSIGLVATLSLGLTMLFLLRSMLRSLYIAKGFSPVLPVTIKRLGILLLLLAYLRQLLLLLAFNQNMGSLGRVLEFRFQLIPSGAIYALLLLLMAQVFSYGLALQHEYEQTV